MVDPNFFVGMSPMGHKVMEAWVNVGECDEYYEYDETQSDGGLS